MQIIRCAKDLTKQERRQLLSAKYTFQQAANMEFNIYNAVIYEDDGQEYTYLNTDIGGICGNSSVIKNAITSLMDLDDFSEPINATIVVNSTKAGDKEFCSILF